MSKKYDDIENILQRASDLMLVWDYQSKPIDLTKASNKLDYIMDIDSACEAFGDDLTSKLLNANDQTFGHDFTGIIKNINRDSVSKKHLTKQKATEEDFQHFLPRCL